MRLWKCTAALACGLFAVACKTTTSELREGEDAGAAAAPPPICTVAPDAAPGGSTVNNFGYLRIGNSLTDLPTEKLAFYQPATDPEASLQIVSALFDAPCDPVKAAERLRAGAGGRTTNIYLYFAGFGGGIQENGRSSDTQVLRWINERDPGALIISLGWNCAAATAQGQSWCKRRGDLLVADAPSDNYFSAVVTPILSGGNEDATRQQLTSLGNQNNQYNYSISHSSELGIRIIDHLLKAGEAGAVGDIRIIGYSGGAHSAADILREDLGDAVPTAGNQGITWGSADACEGGGNRCRVAQLKKVKWSLSMGLAGWSHAMRTFNQMTADGRFPEGTERRRQDFQNGGLFAPPHADYNGKLRVLNRRMDPTATSDDSLQRGMNDLLLFDYNHYGHDYNLPVFRDAKLVQTLDAFLETPGRDQPLTLGILADLAGDVDFDDCQAGQPCKPSANYLAHKINRSHQITHILQAETAVQTTEGTTHPEVAGGRAADFSAAGAPTLKVRTMDQEDLRGAIEFYFRPQSAAVEQRQGLFAHGSCQATAGDLAPRAYLEPGTPPKLVFTNTYGDATYKVELPLTAPNDQLLQAGRWTHLAFAWELPTANAFTSPEATTEAGMAPGNPLLALAAGLRKPPPTTFKYQKGQGHLRIYVNGRMAATAPFGTADSKRACLNAPEVVSNEIFFDGYPPYIPYANYTAQTTTGQLNAQLRGPVCKGYKIRVSTIEFGCSEGPAGNLAGGAMDDIRLILGPGREAFPDVNSATGEPKPLVAAPSYWPGRLRIIPPPVRGG